MKIFAIVGPSGSGKTRLLSQLILELKKDGYEVAVIKHCALGFQLDREGKDSQRLMESGSDGVALVAPERVAIFLRAENEVSLRKIAEDYFKNADFVLIEGGREEKTLKKIAIITEEAQEVLLPKEEELIAVVTKNKTNLSLPVFKPEEVKELASFLENY